MGGSFYMRLYTKEFLADSKVRMLSREHRADLVDLWCHCDQDGSIPANVVEIGRLLGLSPKVAQRTLVALRPFFCHEDGRLYSPRLMRERAAREAEAERKRDGANKTNAKRWGSRSLSESLSDGISDHTAIGNPVASMSPVSSQQSVRTSSSLRSEEARGSEADEPPSLLNLRAGQDPIVLSLPCVGKGPGEWPVTVRQVHEWEQAFPGVAVEPALRQMRLWLEDPANASKRKTYRGMGRFVLGWLGRSQDRPRVNPQGAPPSRATRAPEADDALRNQLEGRQWPRLQRAQGESR